MDILICQSCGIILRGKSKFCTGCGTTVSKFSPTALPVIAHTAAPLAAKIDPDPLVLERALNRMQYATAADGPFGTVSSFLSGGNGHGNGHNGDGGNGHSAAPSATASPPTDYFQPSSPAESEAGYTGDASPSPGNGEAAAISTSRLQSILGTATAKSPIGGAAMSDLISFEQGGNSDQTVGQMAATFEPSAAAAEPASQTPPEFNPQFEPHPQFQPAAAMVPPSEAPIMGASNPATDDFTPTKSPESLPPIVPGGQTFVSEQTSSSAAAAPVATEAPSGLATAARMVAAAGIFDALSQSAPPSAAPVTVTAAPAVEPQPPAPPPEPAPSFFSEPAPMSTSSEPEPAAGFPPAEPTNLIMPPGGVYTSGGSSTQPDQPEASLFDSTPPVLPESGTPQSVATAGGAGHTPAAEQPALEPPAPQPAAPSSAAAPNSDVVAPQPAQPTPQPAATSNFFDSGGGFDFFSQPANAGSAPVGSSKPDNSAGTAAGATPDSPAATDVPDGMPAVIAAAIRAASSQTNLSSVSSLTQPEPAITPNKEDEFPDESVNRGKKKIEDSDAEKADDLPKRRRFSDEDDESGSDSKSGGGGLQLGPVNLPIKQALIGCFVLIFVLFAGSKIFGAIGSIMSGGKGGSPGATSSFSGVWKFGTASRGNHNSGVGQMRLARNGNSFSGQGVDPYGSFIIGNGLIQGSTVTFVKQYMAGSQPAPNSKPISFRGTIDFVNQDFGKNAIPYAVHMGGMWVLQKRQGFGWRATIVQKDGPWEAGLIQPEADTGNGGNITPGPKTTIAQPDNPIVAFIKWVLAVPPPNSGPPAMTAFFAHVAIALLLLGLILVHVSYRMFGPAGTVNIASKKEYIPSQFKAQHYKILHEYGKPLTAGGLPLGKRADWSPFKFWLPRQVAIPPTVRNTNPHMLVIGAGAKGKSRLLANMISHDILGNDRAVVVIDSDGGLIDHLLSWVASHPKGPEMSKRIIVVDPTHGSETLAYNPLEFPEDGDLQNAASAVVFGFKAIYTEPPGSQSQWNQQTANILRNAAILLMANGKTLTDLPVLLSENDFRDVLLEKIERQKNERPEYTTLLEAWGQYKRLARTDQWINWVEPILNRVQPMLGDPRIRPILTKPKGELNLREIINEGRVLLVKIPQGQLDQHANLLGSLLVTGLKQAALSLSLKASTRKNKCALYMDEFDNFIEKETFDAITSETKKFQIGFIGASKTLQGLPEDYRNQIIINVGTICSFALAKKDGDMLGPQMFRVDGRKIKNQTLQNIFNRVNTSPQFELISDEEKLNIDRVVGQEERHFFCYRVGTIAGVFHVKAHDFRDIPDKEINWTLVDKIYAGSVPKQ